MGMTPAVYYGDGSIVVFPCIFPGGASVVLVNGVSSSFTQGAGFVTMAVAPASGAIVQVVPKAVDQGNPTTSRIKGITGTPVATAIKTAPGIVTRVAAYNQAAYAVSIKFYDTAAAVTVGTTVPKTTIVVPATTRIDLSLVNDPLRFDNGIAFTVTKLVADTDTTALAADDIHGFINAQ